MIIIIFRTVHWFTENQYDAKLYFHWIKCIFQLSLRTDYVQVNENRCRWMYGYLTFVRSCIPELHVFNLQWPILQTKREYFNEWIWICICSGNPIYRWTSDFNEIKEIDWNEQQQLCTYLWMFCMRNTKSLVTAICC